MTGVNAVAAALLLLGVLPIAACRPSPEAVPKQGNGELLVPAIVAGEGGVAGWHLEVVGDSDWCLRNDASVGIRNRVDSPAENAAPGYRF